MDTNGLPSRSSTLAPLSPSSAAPASVKRLNESLIAERITTLLSHYWTADDDERLRDLQLGDWLDDLGNYDAPDVATAIKQWRHSQTRRPTPADIVKLVGAIHSERARSRHHALPAPRDAPVVKGALSPECEAILAHARAAVKARKMVLRGPE